MVTEFQIGNSSHRNRLAHKLLPFSDYSTGFVKHYIKEVLKCIRVESCVPSTDVIDKFSFDAITDRDRYWQHIITGVIDILSNASSLSHTTTDGHSNETKAYYIIN